MNRTLTLCMAVLVLVGCEQGAGATSTTFQLPPPPPTQSALQLALDAARQRMDALEAGEWRPKPFILDWRDVQARTNLTSGQNDAFCNALGTPGMDDALATLVVLGLDAIRVRFRRPPLADEANEVIGLAATFAVETCPAWLPVVNPTGPMPTPAPNWYPEGYSIVIGDSNLVWRWSAAEAFQCASGVSACWQIDVLARLGCDRVDAVLHAKDPAGALVDVVQSSVPGVAAEQPTPLGFGSTLPPPMTGSLIHLTCT